MANPIKVIKLTGISGSLEGKADAVHTHVLSDITNAGTAAASASTDFATAAQGTLASNAIQAGTLSSVNADISDATLIDTTDSRLSDARPPTAHSHTLSQITDSGSAAGLDVATVGNAAAGEVVKGNDTRLSDDRDPTAHTHTLSDIADSGTAAASDTTDFAEAVHTHTLSDISDSGTAAASDTTDFAEAVHTHTLSDITDGNVIVKTTDANISGASFVLNEATLVSNSQTKVPTQASVKSYVDNEILLSSTATPFKGAYNASTNTPDITSPSAVAINAGDTYVVETEGVFYSQTLLVGTTLIAEVDSADTENDWTVVISGLDAGSVKIQYESNADTNAFTDANLAKLASIETAATIDQTGAEIKTAYEAETDTNAFTNAYLVKLASIETAATIDQTGAEIKTAYEAEADTNAFTDADLAKLAGIEESATADQTGAEIKTAYINEPKAFTDDQYDKLSLFDPNNTGLQTGAEIKALYEQQSNTNAFTDADQQAVDVFAANNYITENQTSVLGNGWVINDATMATATSSKLATSSSIKSYIDTVTGGAIGSMTFKGGYDAAANIPDLDGSLPREPVTTGDTYIVSSNGVLWGLAVTAGTLVIANSNNPSSISGWDVVLGGGGSGIADISNESIGSLIDVSLNASVNTGEVLLWNGSAFTNQALSISGATVTVDGPTAPTSPSAGDFWFNTETALLYVYYVDDNSSQWVAVSQQGPSGEQGLQGIQGPSGGIDGADGAAGADGADGNTLLNAALVPTGGDGVDGDFFLRTDTSELYGPKTAGVWGSATSLVGPQGLQGFSINFLGELASVGNLPVSGNTQGDAYIIADDKTFRVYDGSAFVSGGSLEGPEGPEGPVGPQGIDGSQGVQGPTGQAMYDLVGTVLTITNDTSADYLVSGTTLTITT